VLSDDSGMKLASAHIAGTARPAPRRSPSGTRRFNRFLVTEDFERTNGRRWSNVGGGETISEALASARADLGPEWDFVRRNHAYGV
jgi:hypothetical protein